MIHAIALLTAGILFSAQDPGAAPVLGETTRIASGSEPDARLLVPEHRGSYCVAIAASRARVDQPQVSFREANSLADPDQDGLTSLHDVARALQALGLRAWVLQATDGQIPPGINIWRIRENDLDPQQFVVTELLNDGRFRYFAPPFGTGIRDADSLGQLWTGSFVHVHAPEFGSSPWSWIALGAGLMMAVVLVGTGIRRRHVVQAASS